MAAIVRHPTIVAKFSGTTATLVRSARVTMGFDTRVAEAQVVLPFLPTGSGYWAPVEIYLTATGATPKLRFKGYALPFQTPLYPQAVTITCRGYLTRADLVNCPTVGGMDLSSNGAGQTDQQMVSNILTHCGLSPVIGSLTSGVAAGIGGTGIVLGTIVPKNFLWAEGQSGLSMIEALDAVTGYRTFDTTTGITRASVSILPVFGSPAFTFEEGVDIFADAATDWEILNVRNRVVVTGADPGLGGSTPTPVTFTEQDLTNVPALIPSAINYLTYQVTSPLIERGAVTDPPVGIGIDAQSVATYWLSQLNQELQRVTFRTPRDDIIAPGTIITVQGSGGFVGRLGVAGNFFVQSVTTEITEAGKFQQTLVCVTGSA